MLPRTTRTSARRAAAVSILWLAAQMLLPVESRAQARDAADEPANPTLQGIPPQEFFTERPAAILPDDRAEAAVLATSSRPGAAAASSESAATVHPVASIAGGLLMIALVTAGIALTVTALRKDLLQKRRRYRRRTRRSSPTRSPSQHSGTP